MNSTDSASRTAPRPLVHRLATWWRDGDIVDARRSHQVDREHLALRRHGARP